MCMYRTSTCRFTIYYETAVKVYMVPEWSHTGNCPNGVRQGSGCLVRFLEPWSLLSYNVLRSNGECVEVDFATKLFDTNKLAIVKSEVNRHMTMGKEVGSQTTGWIFCFRDHLCRKTLRLDEFFVECSVSLAARVQSVLCAHDPLDDQFVFYEPTTNTR